MPGRGVSYRETLARSLTLPLILAYAAATPLLWRDFLLDNHRTTLPV